MNRMSTVASSQGLCSSSGDFFLPPFCERQRTTRTTRGLLAASFQSAYNEQPSHTASTTSFHHKHSPPIAAQTVPGRIRRATPSSNQSTSWRSPTPPPPAPVHSMNQRSIPHQMASQQVQSPSANQMTTALGFACPLPRAARPRTISLDLFHLTPEVIDRAHSMGPGMSGVAYAGGAISGPIARSTLLESSSLPEESVLRLVDRGKRPILRGSREGPTGVQRRSTSPCDKGRETCELHCCGNVERDPPQRIPTHQPSPKLGVTDPPRYTHSLSDSGDHAFYKPDGRELLLAQAAAFSLSPPVPSQIQCKEPLRSAPRSVARILDKSLPIHEESEELGAHIRSDNQEQERDRLTIGEYEDRRYHNGYPHSPMASYSHPGATYNHTTTTSPPPSSLVPGMSRVKWMKPVLPPYSPLPRMDSPYPYPFEHMRHESYAGPDNETMGLSQMDPRPPNVLPEQLDLQLLANNGGMVSDSTHSPPLTPLQYDPLTLLQMNRALSGRFGDSQASTRSSPSHQPVPLLPFARGDRGRRRPKRSQDLHRQAKTRLPLCVESTRPPDRNLELSSIEETSESGPQRSVPQKARRDESTDDEGDTDDEKWVDEDEGLEGVADDDLLHLEFHPDYIGDPEKRRRRWKHRWETILHNLRALDRETNTTHLLLAAPPHTGRLHSVASRTVRRDSSQKSADMKNIRSAFAEISSRQHPIHTDSLLERLSRARLSSNEGSPSSSSGAREKVLRRALDTTIGSLHALGTIYERREMRWAEEKLKLDEDKEKVQLMLKQVLGDGVFSTVGGPTTPA